MTLIGPLMPPDDSIPSAHIDHSMGSKNAIYKAMECISLAVGMHCSGKRMHSIGRENAFPKVGKCIPPPEECILPVDSIHSYRLDNALNGLGKGILPVRRMGNPGQMNA